MATRWPWHFAGLRLAAAHRQQRWYNYNQRSGPPSLPASLSAPFHPPLPSQAYYIHNFKGSGGGALFRSYPGPWQVFSRIGDGMKLVHTQEEAPTLREVALNILPVAARTRSA